MECDKPEDVYKPKHFFLDDKDASYYRNRDLNNNFMKIKYIKKLFNHITSLNSIIDQIEHLEQCNTELDSVKETINSLSEQLHNILNVSTEEHQRILETDYQKIIDDNVSKIRNKELKQNNN